MKKPLEENPFYRLSHKHTGKKEFRNLSGGATKLYVHLCRLRNRFTVGRNHNPDKEFWAWDADLMMKSGIKTWRTLNRSREELVETGFIHFSKDRKGRPTYCVCDDVYQKDWDKLVFD